MKTFVERHPDLVERADREGYFTQIFQRVFNFLADLVENNSKSILIAAQDEIFEEILENMVIQKI